MISAIQFLADHKIIIMPSMKEIDAYKILHENDPHLHDGIKKNAWTWAESDLRPQNFLKGIGYLAILNPQDGFSSDSKNPERCPKSFSSRCITGKITGIIDGDTVQVNGTPIYLTLVSTPKLDEDGGREVKEVVERICPVGADVLVDQDDLRPLDGPASGRIMAVVYCNGVNLNEILVHRELGFFDGTYCYASEFADESWAKEGCSE